MMSPERKDFFNQEPGQQKAKKEMPDLPEKRSYVDIVQAQQQDNDAQDAVRELKKAQNECNPSQSKFLTSANEYSETLFQEPAAKRPRLDRYEEEKDNQKSGVITKSTFDDESNAGLPSVTIKSHVARPLLRRDGASKTRTDTSTEMSDREKAQQDTASEWDDKETQHVLKKQKLLGATGGQTASGNKTSTKWDTPRRTATNIAAGITPMMGETPRRNRWDLTPAAGAATPRATPRMLGATPSRFSDNKGQILQTPTRWSETPSSFSRYPQKESMFTDAPTTAQMQ